MANPVRTPAQIRYRKQKTLAFSTNNKVTDTLARGFLYRELAIRLKGAATVAGASNTLANTAAGDEWGVVKKIEIIANGVDVIRSYSGLDLWMMNYFVYGVPPLTVATFGDGATANPPFDSVLVLPFWMPDTTYPMDTVLDARNMSSLEIAVTWGTFTDINSAASAFTTSPTIEVYSAEAYNQAGNYSVLRQYPIQKTIDATNAQFEIQLPIGPLYRGFMLQFTDAGVDSASILNNFKIVSGSVVYADLVGSVMRDWSRLTHRRPSPNFESQAGTPAYSKLMRSTKFVHNGWYFFDHPGDAGAGAYNTEAIDSLGLSELKLVLDVTIGGGTTLVRVVPWAISPIRPRA